MDKRTTTIAIAALAIAVFTVGIRCSDDTEGGGVTATVDVPSVTEALLAATTMIPQCASTMMTKQIEVPPTLSLVRELVDGLPSTNIVPRGFGLGTFAGNCTDTPGSLTISQVSHEKGVTTLAVLFDAYCSLSQSGMKGPGEKTILSGSATLVDHGKPSDAGPIVSRRTAETDGDGLTLTRYAADGVTKVNDGTISLTGYERVFGTPFNAFSGVIPPSEAAPDLVTIGSFVATDRTNDIVLTGADISVSLYESVPGSEATDLVVTVSQLVGSIGDSGTVSISTEAGAPLVINASYAVVSGTAVLQGASGSASLEALGSNTFAIDVNDEPLVAGPALDCSGFNLEDFFYLP